jgi:hypothetical protein
MVVMATIEHAVSCQTAGRAVNAGVLSSFW